MALQSRHTTAEDFLSLRKQTGMNRKEFSDYLGIPYRTMQDWEFGNRQAPDYLFSLIKEKVQNDAASERRPSVRAALNDCGKEAGKQKKEAELNGRTKGKRTQSHSIGD